MFSKYNSNLYYISIEKNQARNEKKKVVWCLKNWLTDLPNYTLQIGLLKIVTFLWNGSSTIAGCDTRVRFAF